MLAKNLLAIEIQLFTTNVQAYWDLITCKSMFFHSNITCSMKRDSAWRERKKLCLPLLLIIIIIIIRSLILFHMNLHSF